MTNAAEKYSYMCKVCLEEAYDCGLCVEPRCNCFHSCTSTEYFIMLAQDKYGYVTKDFSREELIELGRQIAGGFHV